jgi:hypothetical protein
MLYVKLRDLLAGAWLVVCYRFFRSSPAQSIFESNQKNLIKRTFLGNFDPTQLGSSEMVSFLRGATRAIASLGCEGEIFALASGMSLHITPRRGLTAIFCAATAGGITTVQTVSAAAKTLPTTPTSER